MSLQPVVNIISQSGKSHDVIVFADRRTTKYIECPQDVLLLGVTDYRNGERTVEQAIKWSDWTAWGIARLRDGTVTVDKTELKDATYFTTVTYPDGQFTAKRIEFSNRVEIGVAVTPDCRTIEKVIYADGGGSARQVRQYADHTEIEEVVDSSGHSMTGVVMRDGKWTNEEQKV
jgi:hypothetical protein